MFTFGKLRVRSAGIIQNIEAHKYTCRDSTSSVQWRNIEYTNKIIQKESWDVLINKKCKITYGHHLKIIFKQLIDCYLI